MNFIYELRYTFAGKTTIFYVGRTKNIKTRLAQHKRKSVDGQADVYKFIRDLESVNIEWHIHEVESFEKYVTQEAAHIAKLRSKGIILENEKEGDMILEYLDFKTMKVRK